MLTNREHHSLPFSLRLLGLLLLTAAAGIVPLKAGGYTPHQTVAVAVFVMLVAATALFWEFHLAFAFLGVSALLFMGTLDIAALAQETKLDVIIFLLGMMITVGALKDLGLFSWIITRILAIRTMRAGRFVAVYCSLGVVMSCIVDEIAAIVLISALVFQVADALDVRPFPFVMMGVMAINIGSAGTMLGNPVGIVIGQGADPRLSFNDFMMWSFPVMVAEFLAVMAALLWLSRRDLAEMNLKLERRRAQGMVLAPIIAIPHIKGLVALGVLLALLTLHKKIEQLAGIATNTVLITAPLLVAGLLMIWRRHKVRHYLEHDVEWGSLIFFMMLFMIAGSLERTGVTEHIAASFVRLFGDSPSVLIPAVIGVSALGSAFVENIVFVAAFLPVVEKIDQTPLLWALLHGACLGGNITMVGSTANIVAVSLLEKRYWTRIHFFAWLKTGLIVGIISCLVAWAAISSLAPLMPTPAHRRAQARSEVLRK